MRRILGMVLLMVVLTVLASVTSEPAAAARYTNEEQVWTEFGRYPDLAVYVRAVRLVPACDLHNNRIYGRTPQNATVYAVAEAHFDTGEIWVANDCEVAGWVLKHEAAHLYAYARWADTSEATALEVERGRR